MSVQLTHLLESLATVSVSGPLTDRSVAGIAFDSRRVGADYLFVAVIGTRVDGHNYLEGARSAGASVVVISADYDATTLPDDPALTVVRVENTAAALGQLAAAWYDRPSASLQLVGITGTNGKTTVATLLHQLYTRLGYRAGLISTVEVRIGHTVKEATHTTPDALSINELLAEMVDGRVDYVFMEVSSHAVHQHRITGLTFAGGVFTNLTHDHLDYHGTFAEYLRAKKTFFDGLPEGSFALYNADDKHGSVMVQNTGARKYGYSLRSLTEFRARLIASEVEGLQLDVDGNEVYFKLLGRFNAYNLLAAYGVAILLGQDRQETLVALSDVPGPAGRLERVAGPPGSPTALVDYAHTPDALENVLSTLRALLGEGQRLGCVVGAGGDRDRGKRPEMGRLASQLADFVILTSDNPRSESPEAILDEMEAGVPAARMPHVLRITDRRQAIRTAVRQAGAGVLLVAGKGHETYQEINGVRHPFDDRRELTNALNELARAN